jgi:transcriptional regulator with XRE-family HTH domain
MPNPQQDPPQEYRSPSSDPQAKPLARLLFANFLHRDELAEALNVSPRTLDRWEALRKGPPRVRVGRTILYSIDSVADWLLSQEKKPFPARGRRSSSRVKP